MDEVRKTLGQEAVCFQAFETMCLGGVEGVT